MIPRVHSSHKVESTRASNGQFAACRWLPRWHRPRHPTAFFRVLGWRRWRPPEWLAACQETALQPIKGKRVPKLLWQENRLSPKTASPLVDGGRAYIVNSAGVLNCAQTGSGKVLWRLRLQGPFSSSPVLAGGCLYFFNELGLGQAVRTGEKG